MINMIDKFSAKLEEILSCNTIIRDKKLEGVISKALPMGFFCQGIQEQFKAKF